jgi:opacity protein-like surface antigen
MKKLLVGSALVMAMGTANASNFDGAYAGVTLGSYQTDVDISVSGATASIPDDGNQIGLGVQLGYNKSFSGFNLGAEFQYQGNQGKASLSTVDMEITNGYSLSIMPGFEINESILVYGRLGIGSIDVEASVDSLSETESFDTTVLGLGIKGNISENMDVSFEYKQLKADKTISGYKFEPESTGLELGLQYRF